MQRFDPNSAASEGSGIFGLPHGEKDSALVLLPVPWEATVSYGGGTSKGPSAMREASAQMDLFDGEVERPYEPGIFLRPESKEVRAWNKAAKAAVAKGDSRKADALGAKLNDWVYGETRALMKAGKIVGVVGGDHSVPYGAFRAAAERHGRFGLLHFDAHLDMREAYDGFKWSHASIMRNALDDVPGIERIVSVGIRDYCEQEEEYLRALGPRGKAFFDKDLARARFDGRPWSAVVSEIVGALPAKVWVTFDVDGLDPKLCPHTGTPVPGGLEFAEAVHLIGALARSGRTILGFDLVEVAPGPDEWDANVGMRLLYKMAAWTLASRGLRKAR